MLIRVCKTMAVFSMMLELPRCLCLVKRALKSTGSEEVMAQGLSLWSGLCECFSQGEVGRRECGRWGLIEKKKKGTPFPWEGAMTKTGSRTSAFPAHPTFPTWEVGCCGVSRNVECSGATGTGRCRVQQQDRKPRIELTKAERKVKPSTRNRKPSKRNLENHSFALEESCDGDSW